MCFCLSGYMIDWWTHRRSLAFSFTALYPVFPGQDTACFVDFLWVFFSDISERLSRALTFSPLTLLDLLGSPFGDFYLLFSKPDCLLCVQINPSFPPAFLLPFPPVIRCSLSPCECFLGYALLTHSDSPALWTPCLPTDNHMLPQHSSGKHLHDLISKVSSFSQLLCINICLHKLASSDVTSFMLLVVWLYKVTEDSNFGNKTNRVIIWIRISITCFI